MYQEDSKSFHHHQCRTCVNQTKGLQSLTKLAIEVSPAQMTYGELLKEVANINIKEDKCSGMPQYICSSCSRKLKSSHAFIKQAQEANDKLVSLLNNKIIDNSHKLDCLEESEIDIRQCLEIKMEGDDEIQQISCADDGVDNIAEPKCELILKAEELLEENLCEDLKGIDKNTTLEEDDVAQATLNNQIDSDSSRRYSSESESDEEEEFTSIGHLHKQENTNSFSDDQQHHSEGETKSTSLQKEPKDEEDADIAVPCLQCNKIFNNSKELNRHLRNTHVPEEQKCTCPLCGAKFTRSCNMYKHMRTLHDPESVKVLLPAKEKSHQCDKCPRKYTKKKHLNYHIRAKHSGSAEEQNNKMDEEPVVDSKRKPEIRPLCFICGGSFSNKAHLIVHMRRHTGERPFKCDLCDRAFPRISELTCHRRIHTGEKPYKCKICEKTFRVSTKLATHMRSHTDERPYKCKQCERSFKYSKDLNIHNRIHTGERPYCCSVCGSTFTQSNSLKAHRMKLGHMENNS